MGIVDEALGTQPRSGGIVDEALGGSPSPVQEQPQGKSFGGFFNNVISDAGNVGRGMWEGAKLLGTAMMPPSANPNDPRVGLANLVKGGGQAMLGSYMPNQFPEYAQMDSPAIRQAMETYAPIGESILNPAGIPGRVVDYAYEKPLSTALVASGGLAGAGKVAEIGNLAKTAGVLNKAAIYTNPLTPVVAPIAKVTGMAMATKPIEKIIDAGINKGIRPSVSGQKSFAKMEGFRRKSRDAVFTIAENKNNLQLTDELGQPSGKLPETLNQFSQAIDQTEGAIFKQFDDMAKGAGKTGASLELEPIAKELNGVVNNKVLNDLAPSTADYARAKMESLTKRGVYTVEEAQEAIKILNKSLDAFYKNPTYDTASKAYVDSLVVNRMRSGLDDLISKADGAGYQELKNRYGSLKEIRADVNRRAVVDARKNAKGLIDFSDIFSGSEVIRGIMSLDPASIGAGLTAKSIAKLYKIRNEPNTHIKNMFRHVDKYVQQNGPRPLVTGTPYQKALNPGNPEAGSEVYDIGMAAPVTSEGDVLIGYNQGRPVFDRGSGRTGESYARGVNAEYGTPVNPTGAAIPVGTPYGSPNVPVPVGNRMPVPVGSTRSLYPPPEADFIQNPGRLSITNRRMEPAQGVKKPRLTLEQVQQILRERGLKR